MCMMARDFHTQVDFSGESNCLKFVPNRFRPNICTSCLKEITKHSEDAVESEEILTKALEYTQSSEKVGSLIIVGDGNVGALYLGGYRASINRSFLSDQHVTHVLNTAAGLVEFFGPKYEKSVQSLVKDLKLEHMTLDWDDTPTFVIPIDDIIKGLHFIDRGRKRGNVFVHCAQGKSRSSTIVVAYIMAFMKLPHDQALDFVKEKRKMAQPNAGFIYILSSLNSKKEFLDFQKTI